jgi:hypothetical protein
MMPAFDGASKLCGLPTRLAEEAASLTTNMRCHTIAPPPNMVMLGPNVVILEFRSVLDS